MLVSQMIIFFKYISFLFFCFLFFNVSMAQELKVKTGTASYYAKKFQGRKTSSGEIFSQDGLTCAHKTLPFGTILKVTNLKNDSVVFVKVNDRLPSKSKRLIDLSYKAAKKLNFVKAGLTKVTLEVVNKSE